MKDQMGLQPDYWRLACRVLLESGRARVHNLRNSLNAVALGVELLGDGAGRDGGDPTRVDSIRQQLHEATTEIEALQALLLEAAAPNIQTLPDAAAWAVRMAEPVARRRSVGLSIPMPLDTLPALPVTEGFSATLGELLIAACQASERGAKCTVSGRSADEEVELTVEWNDGAPPHRAEYDQIQEVLDRALEPRGHCHLAADGPRHRLTIVFASKD
jgi:hypothetical protein